MHRAASETTAGERLRTYARYFADVKVQLVLSLILILVQTLALIPITFLLKQLFDDVLPSRDLSQLITIVGTAAALFAANACALLFNRHLVLDIVKSTTHRIRMDLIGRVISRERAHTMPEDLDALHSTLVHDSERVDFMTSALLTHFIPGALVATGLAGVLFFLNAGLFAVTAFVLLAFFLVGKYIGRSAHAYTRAFHDDFAAFSAAISFVLRYRDFITLSAATEREMQRQEKVVADLRTSSQNMSWFNTLYTVVQSNILVVGGVLVLLIGGVAVIEGAMTLGTLLAFYVALNLLSMNARSAVGVIPPIIEGIASLGALTPILSDTSQPQVRSHTFSGLTRMIEIEDVQFRYGREFALVGVQLAIGKGETVGICGASGSGKSTIMNLLTGLLMPHAGVIRVDGRDLTTIDLDSYRRMIGVLPQDPPLFYGTLRENMTYGCPKDVTDGALQDACRRCGLDAFVASLEAGYDTQVGERGVQISGGQRQRIALARALLREPQILLLDEPDNNLSEAFISDIFSEIRALGVTLVVISHSTQIQAHCDRTYQCVPVGDSGTDVTVKEHTTP